MTGARKRGQQSADPRLQLALPDYLNPPASSLQARGYYLVATLISGDLHTPESFVGLRHSSALARMAVPKTSMHKHRDAITGQHDVGTTSEVFPMDAKAMTSGMKGAPNT